MPLMTFFRARHYCLCFNVGQRIKTSFVFFCFFCFRSDAKAPRARRGTFRSFYENISSFAGRNINAIILRPAFSAFHRIAFVRRRGRKKKSEGEEKSLRSEQFKTLRVFGFASTEDKREKSCAEAGDELGNSEECYLRTNIKKFART